MTQTEPLSPAASFEQAIALYESGQAEAALTLCQAILADSPDFFDALHLAGILSTQTGQLEQGLGFLDRAIHLKPHVQLTYANRFLTLQKLERPEEALASLDQAIALLPTHPDYWNHRAHLLRELKRPEEALTAYQQLLSLKPDLPDAWIERGQVLQELERTAEAASCYQAAIHYDPDNEVAYHHLGNALLALHRLDGAIHSYEEAIRRKPDFAGAYWNKGLALLLRGDFANAWPLCEWRWSGIKAEPHSHHFSTPTWLGEESPQDKTVLLYYEQGFGDIIHFCRYARLVKAMGARSVILEVPGHLLRLFARLEGVDLLLEQDSPLPEFDLHCPLPSLPLVCKTFREQDIPARVPYLSAPPELLAAWGEKLGEKRRPRVGLIWNGGGRPHLAGFSATNQSRNIPFPLFSRLNRPDIDFYSLQKGEPAESELLRIKDEHWPTDNFHILTTDIHDFADTAALINHLDLVITVDTSTAHLAGALGKPVWLLNRFNTDWRWMLEREDSPWYPTMRIYRQKRPGAWEDVLEQVCHALAAFAANPGGLLSPLAARWLGQAIAVHREGGLDEAEALYESILQQSPQHFDALHMLGVLAAQRGDQQTAILRMIQAINTGQAEASVHYNLGKAFFDSGQMGNAFACYDQAIHINPDYLSAWSSRGITLINQERFSEALESFEQILVREPDNVEALLNRGIALQHLKRPEEALASYDRAISLKSDYAEAWSCRGNALNETQRLHDALISFDTALALKPDIPDTWNNRSNTLIELLRLDEALASYERALAIKPDHAGVWNNRGMLLKKLGRVDESLDSFDQAIRVCPEKADDVYLNKSTALLLGGRFAEGWPLYEWRWKSSGTIAASRSFPQPQWQGEDIAGKTILLLAEWGFGDTFHFCRYVPMVAARGARVILEVPRELRGVLAGLSGVDEWVSAGDPLPPFDCYCLLMSLPLAFKTFSEREIPRRVPYLHADKERLRHWGNKLGPKDRLRVGLVWSGKRYQYLDRTLNERRNVSFELISRLNHPKVDFYSLQKGEPAESELLEIKEAHWPSDNLHILTSEIHDFADTAALITHLDLVIAVDTSTAHLVGALGKPVWLLSRFDNDWRWMLEREDNPWYPTLRIYRQTDYGDWSEVISRVRVDLASLVSTFSRLPGEQWP